MNRMKTVRDIALVLFVAATVALTIMNMVTPPMAATTNPAQGAPGYFVMTFHFDSQLTATVADKAQWKMPWPVSLIAMKCSFRALGGSASPTYTWTLQAGATNNATCAPTTAVTEVEGTIATAAIADEASMTLDYASAGTSPTADDGTVLLIFKRL